jgi:hypothetical protein
VIAHGEAKQIWRNSSFRRSFVCLRSYAILSSSSRFLCSSAILRSWSNGMSPSDHFGTDIFYIIFLDLLFCCK